MKNKVFRFELFYLHLTLCAVPQILYGQYLLLVGLHLGAICTARSDFQKQVKPSKKVCQFKALEEQNYLKSVILERKQSAERCTLAE